MPTEAKKAGNARHVAKLDQIKLQPYKEEGERIRVAAAEAGMSLQAYVLEAVRKEMSHSPMRHRAIPDLFGASQWEERSEEEDDDEPSSRTDREPRTFRGEDLGPCKFSIRIPKELYLELQKTMIWTRQRPDAFVMAALELYTVFKREGLSTAQIQAAAEEAGLSVSGWLIEAIRAMLYL